MWSFEEGIFNRFYTVFDKRVDNNKDVNGKGTLERFNETIGKDLDENIVPLIENLLEYIYEHETAYDRYVPYMESMFGFKRGNWNLYFTNDLTVRRKVLKYIQPWHNLRGTERLYHILFGMLGLTLVLVENPAGYGFDSPVTFDDTERRFDSTCPTCSSYTMALTGTVPMTPELLRALESIVEFNEPINAQLISLTYNGNPIGIGTPDFNNDYNQDFYI
jgi:hypothetical protein